MSAASSAISIAAIDSLTEKHNKGRVESANTSGASTAVFQLLDDPLEWSSFSRLDTQRAGCWESNLMIEGMHCAACALNIEDVLLRVPGVLRAEVSADSHRARRPQRF